MMRFILYRGDVRLGGKMSRANADDAAYQHARAVPGVQVDVFERVGDQETHCGSTILIPRDPASDRRAE